MPKLTYWVAQSLNDSAAYNIRAKTKKEALRQVGNDGAYYGEVKKVVVEYRDGFDLMDQCLTEGGAGWEPYD